MRLVVRARIANDTSICFGYKLSKIEISSIAYIVLDNYIFNSDTITV